MNSDIADAFCNECRSAYENWVTFRIVFADLPSQAKLADAEVLESPIGQCIDRVYRMCQEAWISQVVRLDDPEAQRNNRNLSIRGFLGADEWTQEERAKIDGLVERLRALPECLKPARDKIVAHNDLPTRMGNITMGGFPEGMDEDYFYALAELAMMVWYKWCAAEANAMVKDQVFVFDLKAFEDDKFSAVYQATRLRDCLCKGLHEQTAQHADSGA